MSNCRRLSPDDPCRSEDPTGTSLASVLGSSRKRLYTPGSFRKGETSCSIQTDESWGGVPTGSDLYPVDKGDNGSKSRTFTQR